MNSKLSSTDVKRVMTNPSADARVETVEKVAGEFNARALNESEKHIAEDIFRHLMKDAEVRVREALSAQLKSCPDVPHDVAAALAKDVDSVALPMLRFSEVLNDDDLIEILQNQGPEKQIAIAQRASLSTAVSGAVIETSNDTAVARLVANEGAALDGAALERLMDQYGADEARANLLRALELDPEEPAILDSMDTAWARSYTCWIIGLPIIRARGFPSNRFE